MPDMTPIRKFLDSLESGQTNITTVLEDIFSDPPAFISNPIHTNWFRNAGALDNTIPEQPGLMVRSFLKSHGMIEKEIAHIDNWNPKQKEIARKAVDDALHAGKTPEHRWGLTHGPDVLVDVQPPAPVDGQRITYLSSQQKLKTSLLGAVGDVKIDP